MSRVISDRRVRFSKIGEEWGINGPADVLSVGAEVEVTKRDKSTSRVRVLTVSPARPGYVDCTIESLDRAGGGKGHKEGTCQGCGHALDSWERRHKMRRCSDCRDGGSRARGGASYYDRHGNFVLGDDD